MYRARMPRIFKLQFDVKEMNMSLTGPCCTLKSPSLIVEMVVVRSNGSEVQGVACDGQE